MNLHDVARELRSELSDPHLLCIALGLGLRPEDRQRQARGVTVRCPRHQGVSCSVTRADDGGVRVRCFGCGFTADAFGLIAEALGLDIRRDFPRVLAEAAQLAHRLDLTIALPAARRSTLGPGPRAPFRQFAVRTARPRPTPLADRCAPRRTPSPPPANYPPPGELDALWRACTPCGPDVEVSALLERRGIGAESVDDFHLARTLPATASLPAWASYRGARPKRLSWFASGHRLLLPVYDALGQMRSVRAWCVRDTDAPKRLPPAGYASRQLVLACGIGVAMLSAGAQWKDAEHYPRIVIAEGEPDFLTWATRTCDAAESVPIVLGIFAGAWSDDFARRIPRGSRVVIRTHHDPAGDSYAEAIRPSLEARAVVHRSRPVP